MPSHPVKRFFALLLGLLALGLVLMALAEPILGGPPLTFAMPAALAIGLMARVLWDRAGRP